MDAGSGTLGALREHIRLDQLDGIWISHLHADHCADLLTAYYGLLYAEVELAAPVPLLAPPGIATGLPTSSPTARRGARSRTPSGSSNSTTDTAPASVASH